jgi:hypothetical protein
MYVKYAIATAAILLIAASPNTAQAYLGNWGGWTGHRDGFGHGINDWSSNYDNGAAGGGGAYDNAGFNHGGYYNVGYNAGVSDAHVDSIYSSHPSICCHSPEWIDGFKAGYDTTWTSIHQQQTTEQGIDNNVNVQNSPGAEVNIYNNQRSDQGQENGGGWGGNGP